MFSISFFSMNSLVFDFFSSEIILTISSTFCYDISQAYFLSALKSKQSHDLILEKLYFCLGYSKGSKKKETQRFSIKNKSFSNYYRFLHWNIRKKVYSWSFRYLVDGIHNSHPLHQTLGTSSKGGTSNICRCRHFCFFVFLF